MRFPGKQITNVRLQRVYGVNRDSNIDFYLRDIAFYDGTCYSCVTHCQKDKINCTTDFDTIIREVCLKHLYIIITVNNRITGLPDSPTRSFIPSVCFMFSRLSSRSRTLRWKRFWNRTIDVNNFSPANISLGYYTKEINLLASNVYAQLT